MQEHMARRRVLLNMESIELIQQPWNHGEEFGVDVVKVKVALGASVLRVPRYHMRGQFSADNRPHAFTPLYRLA